jgi:serine/threonine protein kinase
LIGKTLAHYEITDLLGKGGMGAVYRALDTKLDREVALKVLPRDAAADPERRKRFDQEAKAVAALRHPNIVTIHTVEEVEGVRFLTMELVDGQTLATHVGGKRLSTDAFLELAIPLADAVSAAHEKNIIHRDLKPTNIMLDEKGRLKVLDFGLAKLIEPAPDEDDETVLAKAMTQAGTVVGTAAYMSPEQAEGRNVDPRSDVFSLGIILYELATGGAPFRGTSMMATIAAILTETPSEVTQVRRDLPNELGRIVSTCLDKDPQRRYPSASGLRDDLIRLQEAIKSGVAPAGPKAQHKTSVVVLPFANLSPDPENEYFSDGLTEEVIADLSKVGALRVISRTSAMHLKGAKKNLRTIADELDVQYALEGGVRKAGQSLRITAQLIDVAADAPLWSDKYSGTLEDVFAIQETVSRAIVDSLRVTLTEEEDQKLVHDSGHNAFAYDTYLRARRDIWIYKKANLDRARAELEHALQIVGDDVLLYRGLGVVNWQYVNGGISGDPAYLEEAERYARKIIELDPDGSHGPSLLGLVACQRGDNAGWIRHLTRAVELDPNDSDHLFITSSCWAPVGVLPDTRSAPGPTRIDFNRRIHCGKWVISYTGSSHISRGASTRRPTTMRRVCG